MANKSIKLLGLASRCVKPLLIIQKIHRVKLEVLSSRYAGSTAGYVPVLSTIKAIK